MMRNRITGVAAAALLSTCLGLAVAAQQKPAARARSAAAANTVAVYKSPT